MEIFSSVVQFKRGLKQKPFELTNQGNHCLNSLLIGTYYFFYLWPHGPGQVQSDQMARVGHVGHVYRSHDHEVM